MPHNSNRLKSIAETTIETVRRGFIEDRFNRGVFPLVPYLDAMAKYTRYYTPQNRYLVHWRNPPAKPPNQPPVHVQIEAKKMTTLEGIRYIQALPHRCPYNPVGVLNFASATRPGGGFRFGARAQEESLARSSTLFKSLESNAVKVFYDLHKANGRDPFYSHAMIYTPYVVFFRDDGGGWPSPTVADVLTCAAVNAKKVRSSHYYGQDPHIEEIIEDAMRERMGRILELFEHRGARDLVLGSFGTGAFQNDVRMVAKIWRELLYEHGARYRFSFNSVVFAIPDSKTLEEFNRVFWGRNPLPEGRHDHRHDRDRDSEGTKGR
ncbi:hypothetical protein EST38_g5423 [Candolleomyces aberdarensis]|uniref:Microbial-type PARG catalytic domain-containing protein n=1 Tax=Candolleomyces aberdarensis TaxID=2316362 RepID=A0A4Q2DMK1_9AGAR|nr:hypothetical protein EST38_g5423 [Candolleomyces aberdarensis]